MVVTTFEDGKVYHQFEDGQKLEATRPSDLTEVLKKSIDHEKEKREPQICNFGADIPKKKAARISYKTEYELVLEINKKLTIQRNAAIWFLAGYILTDILFKIFS